MNLTLKEYEAIEAIRVSEIVRLATRDINSIIAELNTPRETTDQMLLGTAFHSLVLRADRDDLPDDVWLIDSDNYRTKEAQRQKANALQNGLVPILIHQWDKMVAGLKYAERILDKYFNPITCKFEQSFVGEDKTFGKIKGRIDGIQDGCVNDLKYTSNQANLDKKIFDMGYQLQMFIYMVLANVEESNLVFFDPNTYLIQVKHLKLGAIKDECVELLNRAKKNMELVEQYKKGELGVICESDYATPQWAYTYLMEQ